MSGLNLNPSLTLVDFGLIPDVSDITERDPADLDFRIWLGWVPSPGRIHVAAILADDVYYNDYDPEDPDGSTMSSSDSIVLRIDADHSGGPWSWIPSRELMPRGLLKLQTCNGTTPCPKRPGIRPLEYAARTGGVGRFALRLGTGEGVYRARIPFSGWWNFT